MKWALYAVLAVLTIGGWAWFAAGGNEIRVMQEQVEKMKERGESDEAIAKVAVEEQAKAGSRTFQGILLAFLSAGLAGVVFVFELLPALAHKFTHAIYDSAEMAEKDAMHDARAFLAQGEYEGAIAAFRNAMTKDPDNRMPWTEIARIQKDHLHDSAAAAGTLREALETKSWPEEDSAFLLFRLAEVYHDGLGERDSAFAVMQQVIDQFPNTRHSANAMHKLQEWSAGPTGETVAEAGAEQTSLEDEEAEFLAKLREKEAAEEAEKSKS